MIKNVRITVMKISTYEDLMEKYENPIEHACNMKLGQTFISIEGTKPEGFCDSAWETISSFVMALAHGGENFYDGWMKNPKSAMISCNDGFRPVSFLLEAVEEENRIEKMESILQRANQTLNALEASIVNLQNMQGDIQKLADYYDSKQWREDFEADEQGRFPTDLKRGVLSEDGIYNLLERNKETMEMLKPFFEED